MEGGEGGAYSRGSAYFKLRPIGEGGGGGGALIRRFTVSNVILAGRRTSSVWEMRIQKISQKCMNVCNENNVKVYKKSNE